MKLRKKIEEKEEEVKKMKERDNQECLQELREAQARTTPDSEKFKFLGNLCDLLEEGHADAEEVLCMVEQAVENKKLGRPYEADEPVEPLPKKRKSASKEFL